MEVFFRCDASADVRIEVRARHLGTRRRGTGPANVESFEEPFEFDHFEDGFDSTHRYFCNEDIVQERFAFLSTLLISPLALDEFTTALIVITNFHMTW